MNKIMCLILARGGSKRIPKKNIKILDGKPLIAYTIECAKKSKHINRIIVSTDDKEIAEVSKKYGAEVPFLRPSEISKDYSLEIDAFKHALNWLKENENYEPDLIVKLFPTSPLRTTLSVDSAIEIMFNNLHADSVRSVRLCSEHPHKMWSIINNRLISFIPPENKQKNAHELAYQSLPKAYIQNASIDVIRTKNILENSILGENIMPFVMNDIESIDINNQLDFTLSEIILKERNENNK